MESLAKHRKRKAEDFFQDGDITMALENYQACIKVLKLEHQKSDHHHRDLAFSYQKIGDCHHAHGVIHSAIEAYRGALSSYCDIDSPKQRDLKSLAHCHHQLGVCYQAQNQLDAASESFLAAVNVLNKLPLVDDDRYLIGFYNSSLADSYFQQENWLQALSHNQDAANVIESLSAINDDILRLSAHVQCEMGLCWFKLEEVNLAEQCFLHAVETMQHVQEWNHERHGELILYYNQLGDFNFFTEQYQRAISAYEQALSQIENLNEDEQLLRQQATLNSQIAQCHKNLENVAASKKYFENAIAALAQLPHKNEDDLRNIAWYVNCIECQRTALASTIDIDAVLSSISILESIASKSDDDYRAIAVDHMNAAQYYYEGLVLEQSAFHFQQALHYFDELTESNQTDLHESSLCCNALGKHYYDREQWEYANRYFRLAVESLHAIEGLSDENIRALAVNYFNAGNACNHLHADYEAVACYQQAIVSLETINELSDDDVDNLNFFRQVRAECVERLPRGKRAWRVIVNS